MSTDETEIWKEYRRAQRQRRRNRLSPRIDAIVALRAKGYDVQELNGGYQFRIDGALDLYPIHQRYHDLRTQTRGGYKDPMAVAVRCLKQGEATP